MVVPRSLRLFAHVSRLPRVPPRDLAARGADEPLPVVGIPRALQRRQEQQQSERRGPLRVALVRSGRLLISARRRELNLAARLTLGIWETAPLASRAWKNQRSQDIPLCRDIASPGLDSTCVELIINYDFPLTLQDFIHRAGRVGRVGSKLSGTIISFVTHPWDVNLFQMIELAARRRSLPGLGSSVRETLSQQP